MFDSSTLGCRQANFRSTSHFDMDSTTPAPVSIATSLPCGTCLRRGAFMGLATNQMMHVRILGVKLLPRLATRMLRRPLGRLATCWAISLRSA